MSFIKKTASILRGGEEERSPKENGIFWAFSLCVLVIWSLGLGIVGLYFASAAIPHWSALFISYIKSPALFALNVLPCLILAFLFYFITNRVWGGVLGSGLVVIAGSFVNFYKITLRNDPFLAADVALASEAAKMTGSYTIHITAAVVLTVICFIAAIALTAWLCKAKIRKLPVRIALILITAVIAGLLTTQVYFDDGIYSNTENIERNAWFMSRWSDRDQYVCRGFLYPFLHSAKNAIETPPEGYDEDESRAYLESFENDDIPEDKKVNIIAVMLEAYNDFSDFGKLEFNTDPYEYFHKLREESISGHLVTNIFAGGTIDTERSFITGYPHMTEYRTDVPTYAGYMASQGYTVEGGHPGFDWFYNRRNVNRYFGFENYYFFEDRYEMPGDTLMMDDEFFNDLANLFDENKETGKPYFSFSVTYQNHGPYADDMLYDPENEYVVNNGYSETAYNILNNYFWGIKRTDMAMEQLITRMSQEEEPVIVVMFGDHNPWLGDNSYVFDEAGISIDRGTEQGFYNYYSTPYFVWANDSAKEVTGSSFTGDGGNFSPCFLMNLIFEECGWEGNAYMKASRATQEKVDVINKSGIYRDVQTGEITNALQGEALEAYDKFNKLEYYMKKDY